MMMNSIQKAELHQEKELTARTRRLSALYTILSASHQSDNLDELMALTLHHVLKISLGQVGSIHILDETRPGFHLAAHQGMNPTALKVLRHTPTSRSFFDEIAQRRKTVFLPDISQEPRLVELGQASGWQVCVCVPILTGKMTGGLLTIYGDQNLQITAEERQLLEILAGQIGIAIENRKLRAQSEQLAIVDERNRLARELHDSVTQSLYSLTLFAETARRMLDAGELSETRRALDEIAESSQQSLKEMRLLVYKLRPSSYENLGLANSLEQRLRAVEGRSGIRFEFSADKKTKLSSGAESALYAIAVEALNNSLKYARASAVRVALAEDENGIFLEIADNGCGFDLEQARQSGGLGLASIEERVRQLNGTLAITSSAQEGTVLQVHLPLHGNTGPNSQSPLL